MALLDLLDAAQGGAYFQNAGKAAGLGAVETRSAMDGMISAIASKLRDKAGKDPEAFETLLDLLEDGGDLDDVESTTGAEAIADGAEILKDLYGSNASGTLSHLAPALDAKQLATLSAISATGVLTGLAQTNANTLADGAATAADAGNGGGGFFSVLVAAIAKGLMQGAARQLAPKRRRRRRTYGGIFAQPVRRRRRRRTVGLDDVFKQILKG